MAFIQDVMDLTLTVWDNKTIMPINMMTGMKLVIHLLLEVTTYNNIKKFMEKNILFVFL